MQFVYIIHKTIGQAFASYLKNLPVSSERGIFLCKPFHLRHIPPYLDNSALLCIMRYPQNFRQAQHFAVQRPFPAEGMAAENREHFHDR